jgi:hypothetical protein
VQELNVHLLNINRLLRHSQVTRQVTARRRHRRQLKTAVHQDHCNFTTSMCNRFKSASKDANELHLTSGVRISGQNIKSRLLQNVNLRPRKVRVADHETRRHR